MIKLSDTQLVLLGAAAQRDDRNVLPLPGSLRGGAAKKVVGALLRRGFIAETVTDRITKADPALNRIWRNDEEGRAILLHITAAGLDALGIEADSAPQSPDEADGEAAGGTHPTAAPGAPVRRAPRAGTKLAMLVDMLRADGGATCDELAAALEWRRHTVRGALAGAVRKRLGLNVTAREVDGRGRVYSIE